MEQDRSDESDVRSSEPRSRAERYALGKSGDKWVCIGFLTLLLSFVAIATGEGWDRGEPWRVALFVAARIVGFGVYAWGHVLLCDSKERSRYFALFSLLGPLGTAVVYCMPSKKRAVLDRNA